MKGVVFADTIGWLHEGRGTGRRGRGVVIAGAHGHEDLCSRRFLRLLADKVAENGLPALQFDYPGCGNAAEDHSTPGQVQRWTASIGAAIDRLKQDCGVADVILVGFRLGALLAPLAAAGRDDVAGLVLLAPPSSGKAYVREVTAMSRMIDAPLASRSAGEGVFTEGREAAGFRISHETLADLSALDWRHAAAGLPSLPMLVLTNGKPLAAEEVGGDTAGAAEIATAEFDGYPLLMCDPTANRIPAAALDRCAAWIADQPGKAAAGKAMPRDVSQILDGPHYTESPVLIGPAPMICGVLCRPRERQTEAEPVIFLNAGGVPHVGWARGTVEAARALAAEGVASLRVDLPGLGLSDPTEEGRLFLYDRRTRHDVSRAINWMERAGYPGVGLVGTCAGAFQAFHAARADRRVRMLTMINPLCFAWNSSYALEVAVWKTYETSKAVLGQNAGAMQESREPAAPAWRGIVSRCARLIIRRGLEAIKSTLSMLHPAALLGQRRVERWMRDLCGRGVRVLLVTSEGDLSLKEIARHFGSEEERLDSIRGVTRVSLPNADHTLTPYHARRAVIARLIDHGGIRRDGYARSEPVRATASPSFLAP
ncbi:alpha/beta fold hydrolase [Mesorhizobium sp. M1A.F.Ca.IN.022.02.1.1]|uniref:alpha/beta fold hydrolase n=10 Tax=Mesorhizobium TaxID=68287 RepID=UPI000FCA04F9|nr:MULTISPECIES: alpha/beta fold hydrolase [unclassified Mesorhizobium]RWI56646.1 MAG: alpha/beta fold hydrolase [Mesorhizobium sp.]MCT2579163.1 alpha/beta hydrolase [Mesorhizobium sp. P13.3]MDF3168102.1 alpha/beta fold hydrolase [Mesorhizobium sp. P16.1]MDF3179990.1 alpha/beta fold hydrolase [Mesorhizobium sp. P17.1]MDF3185016.1 alpha/beta fold hydrolase [Mesorhizobium sp. ICCV3110.1]